jgi:hypothetical protein
LRVSSHGRLRLPASRVTAWREKFYTPVHYCDDCIDCATQPGELVDHFDMLTSSTCNICGGHPGTKDLMAPGKYETGVITGEYKSGGRIKLKYQTPANHLGYVQIKLCINNHLKKDTCKQTDFDKYVIILFYIKIEGKCN